jgi:gluconokinase
MVIIVMGVSGAGKTTVGEALAGALGWRFLDGDHLHPPANVAKMARGDGLTDADRQPWLAAIRAAIVDAHARGESLVVACSALKARYRRQLAGAEADVVFVHLDAAGGLLAGRLARRRGHFAGPALLASQIDALEPPSPAEALIVEADRSPEALVTEIRRRLNL